MALLLNQNYGAAEIAAPRFNFDWAASCLFVVVFLGWGGGVIINDQRGAPKNEATLTYLNEASQKCPVCSAGCLLRCPGLALLGSAVLIWQEGTERRARAGLPTLEDHVPLGKGAYAYMQICWIRTVQARAIAFEPRPNIFQTLQAALCGVDRVRLNRKPDVQIHALSGGSGPGSH